MISAENLMLLLNFVMGFIKIVAIPLGAVILAVVLLRQKKTNR
jgi:hypothetical protein